MHVLLPDHDGCLGQHVWRLAREGQRPRVSSRIFLFGGKIVCKDQLCVKHAKFLSLFLSINHQCTKKHKARVFIIINCQNFLGGKLEGLGGGEASPLHLKP